VERAKSIVQQGIQHLHDHDQQVVQGPVVVRLDPVAAEISTKMLNGFFRFPTRDLQRPRAIPPSASTEASLILATIDCDESRI